VSPEETPRRLIDGGARTPEEEAASELLDRSLPLPQGDDLSRERVWRAVAKQLPGSPPRRSGRLVWATAAAFGVAALVGAGWWRFAQAAPVSARLELTAGSVFTALPETRWAAAEAGAALPLASRVKVDPTSRALIGLKRAGALLSEGTDLGLESLGRDTFLRLAGGAVLVEAEHRAPGETFVVQTSRYRVEVRGTVFSVRERAPDDVTVSVSRGLVEVSGEGGRWQVPAGRSWNSRARDALGPDEISASDRGLVASAVSEAPRALIRVDGDAEARVSEGGLLLGVAPITWSAPVGRYHFRAESPRGVLEADATASPAAPVTVTLAQPSGALSPRPKPNDRAELSVVEPPAESAPPLPPAAAAGSPKNLLTPSGGEATRSTGPLANKRSAAQKGPSRASAAANKSFIAERGDKASVAERGDKASVAERDDKASVAERGDKASVAERGDKASATESGNNKSPVATSSVAERAPASTPAIPSVVPREAKPPVPSPPANDAYATALTLRNQGRFVQAAELLEQVAASHDTRSSVALAELGRLQQRNLGQAARALETYDRYQREYPRGTLVQEVRLSAIELELQRQAYDSALERMNTFLAEHANSERAGEVHVLRANVLRERGDCRRALTDYAQASAPAQADDALYFTAWCHQHLGERDEAAASFSSYLARFPSGRHAPQARAALGQK
jgi:tetratricopeptide (TPR) repeat protein